MGRQESQNRKGGFCCRSKNRGEDFQDPGYDPEKSAQYEPALCTNVAVGMHTSSGKARFIST